MAVAQDDLTAFAVAFSIVWGGLALYLVYLHRFAERVAEELERARERVNRR